MFKKAKEDLDHALKLFELFNPNDLVIDKTKEQPVKQTLPEEKTSNNIKKNLNNTLKNI